VKEYIEAVRGRYLRAARKDKGRTLAEVAVPRELFRGVLERIGRLSPAPG
jgi:hypothetical protein